MFDEPGLPGRAGDKTCLVVGDDANWSAAVSAALGDRAVRCVHVGAGEGAAIHSRDIAAGFDSISEQVAAVERDHGPLDAVVVALRRKSGTPTRGSRDWERILEEHRGIVDDIGTDAAWYRAVADLAAATGRPLRAVMLVDAESSGGRTRAQASTQLSRAAHNATGDLVDACTVSVESAAAADVGAAAELTAHLVCGPDTAALSGAELMVSAGWLGLRSHPNPRGSITFGGPSIPDWLDTALRRLAEG